MFTSPSPKNPPRSPYLSLSARLIASTLIIAGLSGCGWTRSAYEARQLKQLGPERKDWGSPTTNSSLNTPKKPELSPSSKNPDLTKNLAPTQTQDIPNLLIELNPPAKPRQLQSIAVAKPSYQAAYQKFSQQEYQQAITDFQVFLLRYPNDVHSDNAQFWIGESHFRLGDPDSASKAYRQVLTNYEHRPSRDGYKTPEAMYRLGEIAFQQQKTQQATQYLKYLQQNFPQSPSAKKATRLLQQNS